MTADGNVVYRLRRSWRDGTSHLVFTPHQFIQRLIALVPPPRFNLTRFHGVLAPASKLRPAVVPQPQPDPAHATTSPMQQRPLFGPGGQPRSRLPRRCRDGRPRTAPRARVTWVELLQRTFPHDRNASGCPRCGGRLTIVVPALPPAVLRRMLASQSTDDDPLLVDTGLARGPPRRQTGGQLELFDNLEQQLRPPPHSHRAHRGVAARRRASSPGHATPKLAMSALPCGQPPHPTGPT